ncbi:MAG: hypothetical protein AAB863_03310 [Patescibacteria group bacterium]
MAQRNSSVLAAPKRATILSCFTAMIHLLYGYTVRDIIHLDYGILPSISLSPQEMGVSLWKCLQQLLRRIAPQVSSSQEQDAPAAGMYPCCISFDILLFGLERTLKSPLNNKILLLEVKIKCGEKQIKKLYFRHEIKEDNALRGRHGRACFSVG